MKKDIKLQRTEQTTPNRIIQNGWSSIDQVVDYLEGFRYKPRSTSSIPSHQSEYRGMPFGVATAPRQFTKTLKSAIMELRLVDVETRNNRDQEPLEQSKIANSRGQELDETESGIRVSGLGMENQRDDLLANCGQEKMHAQRIKIIDEQKQHDCKPERLEQPSIIDIAVDEGSKLVIYASKDGGEATLKTKQLEKRMACGH
ncbi:MAG: hypothetical protein EZS28_045041 [Streblomastix strix]|uniref:Uncharacterized protein n=1 Tax=Streblomastix strix TaxID=222440 RepID=A0A5J4TNH3_9EUKA|nr:MAG: hypothetical protein EZS28_045041 [Streblomastix strix]